jgi:hypothetical protein
MRLLMESTICFLQIRQHCGGLTQTALMTSSSFLTLDKNSGNSVKKDLEKYFEEKDNIAWIFYQAFDILLPLLRGR